MVGSSHENLTAIKPSVNSVSFRFLSFLPPPSLTWSSVSTETFSFSVADSDATVPVAEPGAHSSCC